MQLSSRRLAGAFALPALLALFHAPLLFGPQAVWYAGDDNAYQVLPWLELQAREWRAGRVPLWDPYSWMGQPLAGQMQPAVTAPLHWVLLPLRPAEGLTPLFFNLYFLTIRWIAAAAMYRLARSLGCGRVAGIAAGFAFATVGWFAFQTRPQMAMSAMWAPLALLYLLKGARGDGSLRHAVLGGFFLGLCWLGGHHQAPLFLSTGAAFAWLALLIRNWRCWRAAAAFFLTTAAASALVLLPAMEYGRRAVRWAGTPEPLGWKEKIPYEIHRQYSLNPDAIPSIFWPGYRGKLEPFSGIVLIIAALFALLRWRRRPEALLLGGLGLSGLLLSLGPAGALHPLLYRLLPHFDKARAPEAALVLLAASLPALAALGLEGLAEGSRRAARLSAAAAFLAFAGLTAAAAARASLPADPRWTSAAAAACLAIALLAATRFRLPAPLLAAAAVAMLWIEARPLYRHVLAPVQDAQAMKAVNCLQAHTDIARFLRSQGGCWRIEVDDADVPCNFGDWHALPQTHGYLASATENIYRHELHTEWAKRLFGVRYRVAKTPSPTHAHPVFEGASGVRVWERRDVLPRVFTVHEAEPLPDRRQAAGWLYLIRGRLAEKTFLPGSVPAMERCAGPDSVRLVEYSPLHARIEAAMACRGMLILTDTWYPGWRAAIDGREVPIHEAYAAVRGVVVEAGLHTVDFRYRPASILWGAAWTGAAFGLAAFCARRRRLHW